VCGVGKCGSRFCRQASGGADPGSDNTRERSGMNWQDRLSWLSISRRSDVRLTRFRQALLAAQRARAYHPILENARLAPPGAGARLEGIEEALPKLAPVDWSQFSGCPDHFQNPAAPLPESQRLRNPTAQRPRTAVLMSGFVESSRVRVFRPAWIGEIRRFHPETIAGPLRALMPLA